MVLGPSETMVDYLTCGRQQQVWSPEQVLTCLTWMKSKECVSALLAVGVNWWRIVKVIEWLVADKFLKFRRGAAFIEDAYAMGQKQTSDCTMTQHQGWRRNNVSPCATTLGA